MVVSVEEMHVAVENECEKSNGESESNVVEKLATEVVEKDMVTDAGDSEIYTNLNGVKASSPVEPVIAAEQEDQQHTNIPSIIIKEQEKDKENKVDQKNEEQNDDGHDDSTSNDKDNDQTATDADNDTVVTEKPTSVVSNGVSYNVNDDIEEEDIVDEDVVADEPSPSSVLQTNAKEQAVLSSSADSSKSLESASKSDSEAIEFDKNVVSESKESEYGTINVTTTQNEPSTTTTTTTKITEDEQASIIKDIVDEKMETDDDTTEDIAEQQKSPTVDEKSTEHGMETEETKDSSSSSQNAPPSPKEESSPVSSPSPLATAIVVEKLQEPVTNDTKESSMDENSSPVTVTPAEKPTAAVAEVTVTDNAEEMDTSDVEAVIETEHDQSPKSIVNESKLQPVPIIEIKPIESLIEKDKLPGTKIEPVEDAIPVTKIIKKPAEPEKESATKESTNVVSSVKRKAADTGEEPEQDRDGGISSSSSHSSGSEADNAQDCKRIRFDESIFEEDERERLIREFVERSTETSDEIGKNCDKLQHEIAALSDLARAKELEWNSIMRLLKLKEEMLERILFKKRHLHCQSKPELDANLNKMYKNFVTSSTTLADQKPNRSETSTPTNINSHITVMPISGPTAAAAATSSGGTISNATSSQDLYSSSGGKSPAAINSTLASESLGGKLRPQHRPILPKPPVSSATQAQAAASATAHASAAAQQSSHLSHTLQAVQQAAAAQAQQPTIIQPPHSSSSQQLQQQQQQQQHFQQQQQSQSSMMASNAASLLVDQNSIIGEGRQGPILDVKSIIADFRSKNPDALPRRGRRNVPFGPRGVSDGGPPPRFLANTSLLSMANIALGSGSHIRTSVSSTTHNDHRPNNFIMGPGMEQFRNQYCGMRVEPDPYIYSFPGSRAAAESFKFAEMENQQNMEARSQESSEQPYSRNSRPGAKFSGQDNSVPTSLTRTEMQMRHPTIDSLMLSVNQAAAAAAASGNSSQPNSSTNSSSSSNSNNDYFRETLVKIAKMSEKRGDMSNATALHLGGNNKSGGGSHLPPPPPYPEVTLHPVLVPQSSGSPPVQNSLLHGILTKSNAAAAAAAAAAAQAANNQHHPSSTVGNSASISATSVGNIQHRPTTFSPTLARLLTAPERSRGHRTNIGSSGRNSKSALNEILNSKKTRTEVTITPVTTSTTCATRNGSDVVLDDDDESEVADRLVIDEGREVVAESASNVIPADQVPECQGCHKKAAQFVCAGCGNQWYCSRECQVQAWEDHSEMCSG